MNIIYETSVKEAKPLPDFSGTDDSFVSLTLNGLVLDKNMLSLINKIGNERLDILATLDFLTINSMFYNRDLTASMRSRLRHLTEMGIVEHVGRKKYVLARSLYSAAGKPGVHRKPDPLHRKYQSCSLVLWTGAKTITRDFIRLGFLVRMLQLICIIIAIN